MNRILVATDGSAGSDLAAREGLRLARALEAPVTFVSVIRPPLPVLGDPYYQRAVSDELHRAGAAVAAAMSAAEQAGVTADYELLEGRPAEQVVDLARLRGVELIVVGCRALGPVAGAPLGSVSGAIVRHSEVPVLVAKSSVSLLRSHAA